MAPISLGIIAVFGFRLPQFIKHKCVLAYLVAIVCLLSVPKINAQPVDGCALSSWVMQQQPHSTRTHELAASDLRDTQITINGTSHKISIPAGFTMTVFASGIPACRGLACSPDGVIYATSYGNGGKVYAFPDHNHDGVPDSVITVATGLGDPHGIGFYKGGLYVSNNGALYHLVTNGTTRIAINKDTISLLPTNGNHRTRNFVFDAIKDKIYLQIGSNGNMDADTTDRAQIVEMHTDGTGYRVFARGIRNGVGMDLDPRTDALWVNNNGMDNLFQNIFPSVHTDSILSDNNPSECVYLVCDGKNYGWPYCYGFQMRNPQPGWVDLDTNVVRTFSGPVAEVLAHEAPLGLHFYRGTKFPELYHNAIFQCYHGSWNRYPPAPPRITVMWADSEGRNAKVEDFVNGFFVMGSQPDSGNGTYFGRPVSIIEGGDSAMYVSDDQNGVIYRIAYTASSDNNDVALDPSGAGFKLGPPTPNPAGTGIRTELTLGKPSFRYCY